MYTVMHQVEVFRLILFACTSKKGRCSVAYARTVTIRLVRTNSAWSSN